MSLTLYPSFVYGDLDLTAFPFMVPLESIDFSSGDLVTSVLSSFLQDGELEMSERRGNMTLTIPILVEGQNLLNLAQAEALLAAESEKETNRLTIDPGDGNAPPTVFDTFRGTPSFGYAAAGEQNGMRRFLLTLSALPYGGSDFQVVAAAVSQPGAPSTVSVNNGSVITGWTSTGTGSASISGGQVLTTVGQVGGGLLLTAAVDTTGTPYVWVDWRVASGPVRSVALVVDGGLELPPVAAGTATLSGYSRSYFEVPQGTHASFEFRIDHLSNLVVDRTLRIDQVSRTNVPPVIGTTRQQARTVPVAGSARTQGEVQISSTVALGDVMVYTNCDSDYVPALRRFGPAGTADASLVSGQYNVLSTPFVVDVPAAQLPPGLYSLIARVNAPSNDARNLTWTTVAQMGGLSVGRTISGTASLTGSSYQFVALGNVNLPTMGFRSGSSGSQRFTLADSAPSSNPARVDELYAYNITTGKLSMVACGTGTPAAGGASSRLWLDAATLTSRVPTVMRGTLADGSDAVFAGDSIICTTDHEFSPTWASIFTVATNATDSQVALAHTPRWLGHAALVLSDGSA